MMSPFVCLPVVMRAFVPRTLLCVFCLICLQAWPQENIIHVGVALPSNETKGLTALQARDRLVKAINQQKRDKKWNLTVQAVPIDAALESQAIAEAQGKKCEFILFSRLTGLRSSEKVQAANMQGTMDYSQQVTATVEYRVSRAVDSVGYSQGMTTETESSAPEAVLRAMARIAPLLITDFKKGGNAPTSEAKLKVDTPALNVPVLEVSANYCGWLPSDIPHADALRGVCDFAITLPQKMPNFICQQETSRYWGKNTVPADLITASVRYEDGTESYSGIKVNGKPAPAIIGQTPGLWSTGEFGSNLRAIFSANNRAAFEYSAENLLGSRRAWIFTYRIAHQNEELWRLHGGGQILAPPYDGELWVDEKTGAILRFSSVAKHIPHEFPTQSAELLTDYASVSFADGTSFQLPAESTVATKYVVEEATRNVVRFRECQKFRAKAHMVLNIPTGMETPATSASVEELRHEIEQNEQIYAILRDQAVRENTARLQQEYAIELEQAGAAAFRKVDELKSAARNAEEAKKAEAVPRPSADTAGNSAPAGAPLATVKVSVKLVPVSVVLRDGKGDAVGNLRKEDFELLDNGKPQPITSFSIEKAGEAPAGRSDGEEAAAKNAIRPAPVAGRSVAYLFDDLHADFGDLAQARDAALKHVDALAPDDRAAIFTTSGSLEVEFTSDHAKLHDGLSKLRARTSSLPRCPPMSEYMADLIANRSDTDALAMATADTNKCAFAGMKDDKRAEQIAKTTAFEMVGESSAKMQATLGNLRNVLRRTETAPGSRSIVLVSPGFLTLTPETRQSVMEIVDEAVRAGVMIHTLDVRGLYVTGMGGNLTHPSNPVARFAFDREEAAAQGDPMAELAYGTGGTYFHNNNDANEGFRRTADTPAYVYILGFSPQTLDGKFHKLKVRLLASNKVTVQARQGYIAEKPAAH